MGRKKNPACAGSWKHDRCACLLAGRFDGAAELVGAGEVLEEGGDVALAVDDDVAGVTGDLVVGGDLIAGGDERVAGAGLVPPLAGALVVGAAGDAEELDLAAELVGEGLHLVG